MQPPIQASSHPCERIYPRVDSADDLKFPEQREPNMSPVQAVERRVPHPRGTGEHLLIHDERQEVCLECPQRFLKHPDWARMRDLPRYADTVSKITSTLLRPAEGSDI